MVCTLSHFAHVVGSCESLRHRIAQDPTPNSSGSRVWARAVEWQDDVEADPMDDGEDEEPKGRSAHGADEDLDSFL